MLRFLSLILFVCFSFSQTTGKISGFVSDKEKGSALPGANIYIINSAYGTASDSDGRFTIINVPPGKYTLKVDMIGYKSIQLDDLSRGFSFKSNKELDMSMGQTDLSAKKVLNSYSCKDLKDIIKNLGDEEEASKISKNIVEERFKKQINTTDELVKIIKKGTTAVKLIISARPLINIKIKTKPICNFLRFSNFLKIEIIRFKLF